MNTFREITDELAIAGQPTLDELQPLAEAGYRSVVNLRSPDETGFLDDEQQKTEFWGLCYVNIPIQIKTLKPDDVSQVIQQLMQLPKPILIHCDNGIRASTIVLVHLAIKQGMGAEDAFQKVTNLGLLSDSY